MDMIHTLKEHQRLVGAKVTGVDLDEEGFISLILEKGGTFREMWIVGGDNLPGILEPGANDTLWEVE